MTFPSSTSSQTTLAPAPSIGTVHWLRVAMVFHGQIVRDEVFLPQKGKRVLLGGRKSESWAVPLHGIEKGFELFRPLESGGHLLRLTDAMVGKLHLGQQNLYLDEIFEGDVGSTLGLEHLLQRGASRASGHCEVVIWPGDWGLFRFGVVDLIFQYVPPPTQSLEKTSLGSLNRLRSALH